MTIKEALKTPEGLRSLPQNINFLMNRMELLKALPDKSIDLALIDHEYGINAPRLSMGTKTVKGKKYVSTAKRLRMNKGGGQMKNSTLVKLPYTWDVKTPPKEFFEEIFRVSKNQIIWGGNYFPLPPTRCWILWDKLQALETFSSFEMAWTSFDQPTKIYKIGCTGGRNDEEKIHPNQKPIKLYERTLVDFAKPGQIILDTGIGSGSIRIAVERQNRYGMKLQLIGCENNYNYHASEYRRFQKHSKLINNLKSQAFIPFGESVQTEIFF
jgi:site-specific DNA-methyltransferase (adenine-specific)